MRQINEENPFFQALCNLLNWFIGDGRNFESFLTEVVQRLPRDLKEFCQLIGVQGADTSQLIQAHVIDNVESKSQIVKSRILDEKEPEIEPGQEEESQREAKALEDLLNNHGLTLDEFEKLNEDKKR